MTDGPDDNVLDLRIARWRRDPTTRALLEAIDDMTPAEREHLLEYHIYFIWWCREHGGVEKYDVLLRHEEQ